MLVGRERLNQAPRRDMVVIGVRVVGVRGGIAEVGVMGFEVRAPGVVRVGG